MRKRERTSFIPLRGDDLPGFDPLSMNPGTILLDGFVRTYCTKSDACGYITTPGSGFNVKNLLEDLVLALSWWDMAPREGGPGGPNLQRPGTAVLELEHDPKNRPCLHRLEETRDPGVHSPSVQRQPRGLTLQPPSCREFPPLSPCGRGRVKQSGTCSSYLCHTSVMLGSYSTMKYICVGSILSVQ